MSELKYKRVLLKLSGEVLAGKQKTGVDVETVGKICDKIKEIVEMGVQVAIVVGGGNFWRGRNGHQMERTTADYMGMLGTMINSLALQSAIEQEGIACRVLSSISATQVAEPYIRRRAIRHLEKGRVIIFAGGTGNPFFTTDTTAALRAKEVQCDVILMAKNGVDGVYSADPNVDPTAKLLKHLTYRELLQKELKVMDSTAVSLLKDSNVQIRVFNMSDMDNFMKVITGSDLGTTITKEN